MLERIDALEDEEKKEQIIAKLAEYIETVDHPCGYLVSYIYEEQGTLRRHRFCPKMLDSIGQPIDAIQASL